MRRTTAAGGECGHRSSGSEDCAGYEVCDPLGRKIGKAEKLFVNGDGGAEYVRVRLGLFGRSVLIPVVEGVAADAERRTLGLR